MMVGLLLALSMGEGWWSWAHALLSSLVGRLVLFGFTFALFFHTCNGIRHFFWDMGKGFSLQASRRSGQWVLLASMVLTAATWGVAIVTSAGGGG